MEGECLARYLAHCRPFEFAAPWDFLAADQFSFRAPSDPGAVFQQLATEYTSDALVNCGLALPDGTGAITPHPSVRVPNAPLIALQPLIAHRGSNLLYSGGSLLTPRAPFFAGFMDRETFRLMGTDTRAIAVTEDLDTAILLRACGIAATPSAGLCELNEEKMNLFSRLYGFVQMRRREPGDRDTNSANAPAESRRMQGSPYSYVLPNGRRICDRQEDHLAGVLAAWSLFTLSGAEPSNITGAEKFLDNVCDFRGFSAMDLYVWRPSPEKLHALQLAVWGRQSTWVRATLRDSLLESTKCLTIVGRERPQPPADLPPAKANLDAPCGEQDYYREEVRDQPEGAKTDYDRLASDAIVGPILATANCISDPVRRAQTIRYAKLTFLFHDRLAAWQVGNLSGNQADVQTTTVLSDKLFADILKISSQLNTLEKEVYPCPLEAVQAARASLKKTASRR